MRQDGFRTDGGAPASSRPPGVTRRGLLRGGGATVGGVGLSLLGAAPASARGSDDDRDFDDDDRGVYTPEGARRRLLKGNARWVSGRLRHPHQSVERREEVAEGQRPFAVVVVCIDSRVTPELIFDTGIGDLFVVRTAAQLLDAIATGSVQYGPAKLSTPLVVVLGHQRCGAVTAAEAALREGEPLPGHLQDIAEALRPAYDEVDGRGGPNRVDRMIRANSRRTVESLKRDALLAPLIDQGALDVAGGYYSLDTGRVRLS
ncbi:carbonic anhydrase [Streptomonospora sp. PA3]|uniref:carbonic anhydrase n=1 Tax=Streptomonospora sp. PA3 TaxID=2607326 RepID=UPI0012DCB163|nr:carbonic anhydrase [Streptomonospora sp. PA3]MUL42260.1 carbonic anhydrase [Streptomonospora sp. PA3]